MDSRRGLASTYFPLRWLLIGLASTLGACGADQQTTTTSTDGEVVARFGDQEITVSDVDARVLAMPASSRPAPGADLEAWYTDLVREMMVDAVLRAEAEPLEEEPAFTRAREEAKKQLDLNLCLAALHPGLERVTKEDLEGAYEERAESFTAPERRFVYHIFLRRSPGTDPARRVEIQELRDRALRGESFPLLAKEHSDSEARHREGLLGWIVPGVLPEGFESVIFELPEGVPSEPLTTRDGFHLFFVDQVLPARTATLEEMRPKLAQGLVAERRLKALSELASATEAPAGSLVLDREAFSAAVAASDAEKVVLRIGATEVTFGDLRRSLGQQQAAAQGDTFPAGTAENVPEDVAWEVLERMRRRELALHHCRVTGRIPAEASAKRLEAWTEDALLRLERRRRMVQVAERDEERLRLFYQSNIGDFSTRPRWHVRRLSIPISSDAGTEASAVMLRLEEAAAGDPELESLQGELGGEIEDLGFLDLASLRRLNPKLPGIVTPMEAGELVPPYRLGDRLEIVEVVARQEAEARPFEEVRGRVAAAYVEKYTHEVYEELSAEILGDGLDIDPEALAALRRAGLPQPDVTVDQLDELLDQL